MLTHSFPLFSGPEQHRDSHWGDVCWHCSLQEQGTDQLFSMVSETHIKHEITCIAKRAGPLLYTLAILIIS